MNGKRPGGRTAKEIDQIVKPIGYRIVCTHSNDLISTTAYLYPAFDPHVELWHPDLHQQRRQHIHTQVILSWIPRPAPYLNQSPLPIINNVHMHHRRLNHRPQFHLQGLPSSSVRHVSANCDSVLMSHVREVGDFTSRSSPACLRCLWRRVRLVGLGRLR